MRNWLKNLRDSRQLSQSDIAQKLQISQNYYSMIENGERQKQLSMELAQKIADVFGITLDDISKHESEVK